MPVLTGQPYECRIIHPVNRLRQVRIRQPPANQILIQYMTRAAVQGYLFQQVRENRRAGYAVNGICQQEYSISAIQTGQAIRQTLRMPG